MSNSQQQALFETPQPANGLRQDITGLNVLFEITVPGKLPSLNELFGMEQWARYQLKGQIQNAFLSALRASAKTSSTKTTSAPNSILIACDTLDSYLAMRRKQRALKSAKKKLSQALKKKSESKSSNFNNPPF